MEKEMVSYVFAINSLGLQKIRRKIKDVNTKINVNCINAHILIKTTAERFLGTK